MRILLTGGGTAGHINPAIAIANYIKGKEKDSTFLFVGTERGLEKTLVPKCGYDIKFIEVMGLKRSLSLENFKVLINYIKSQKDAKRIIKEFKPDAVIGTGGYVCAPVVKMAAKLKIPTLIHEQNVYPGLTVKGSGRYVDYIAVSFEETVNHIKCKDKCVVVGNPVREAILNTDREEARRKLGLDKDDKFVLVFGGSLGAYKINEAMIKLIKKLDDDKIKKM